MRRGSTASASADARDGLALALVLGASALALAGWFDAPLHRPQDEGQLLVLPELVRGGAVLHRDVFASYPPGVFWLLACVFEVFGSSIAVERSVGLAIRLVLVAAMFALGRPFGRAAAVGAAAACACVLAPLQLAAFAWLGGLALAACSLALLHMGASSARRAALAGVLAGCALTFRLDLALAVALGLAPFASRALAAGLALGLAPLALHALAAGVGTFIDAAVIETVIRIAPQRRLAPGDVKLSFELARQLALPVLGAAAAGAAALVARRAHDRAASARLASLALFALGLAPQAAQRLDGDHLLYVGCFASALLPIGLAAMSGDRGRAGILAVAVALLFALPQAGLFVDLARGEGPAASAWVERAERRIPVVSEAERDSVAQLVRELEARARPGQRLFVGPRDLRRTYYADVQLYWLFPELVPASYFIDLNPGSADRPGSRLAGELERADFVVASRRWDAMQRESAWAGSPDAALVLARDFELRFEKGPWALFERRDEAAR